MEMLRFEELYKQKIKKDLQTKFNYANPMQVPSLKMICINMCDSGAVADSKVINAAVSDLTLISGQKPVITLAKKSISTFKLRAKMAIGCKVTLRKKRMYEFLERMVLVALPRVRDFRGFSVKNFDGKGNITIGFKDQLVFPEINYDKIDKVRGMDVTLVTTATTDSEAKELLAGFHIPFIKTNN